MGNSIKIKCKKQKMMRILFIITLLWIVLPMKTIDYDIASIKKAVTVDTSMYKITYSLKFKYSQNDKDYQTDTRIVQIGKHYVKDYSEILYHYDSLATVNLDRKSTRLNS